MYEKVKYVRRFRKFQICDYWVCGGFPLTPTGQIKKKIIFQTFPQNVVKFMLDLILTMIT